MKTYTDWLREWLYEGKRALPLLHEWLDALVALSVEVQEYCCNPLAGI